MQDITIRDKMLAFDGIHPTNLLCMLDEHDGSMVIDDPNYNLYIESRNLLISTSRKAASSSLHEFARIYYETHGEQPLVLQSSGNYFELLYTKKPTIWFLYRDPFTRLVSYFYYIGNQIADSKGVIFSWDGFDPYRGNDKHRIPQCATIPFYLTQEQRKTANDYYPGPDATMRRSDYRNYIYPYLSDAKLYEDIKFFWIPEVKTRHKDTKGIFLDLSKRLDIPVTETSTELATNKNFARPPLSDIPMNVRTAITKSQTQERLFLSSLTWENQDPVFWA